MDVVPVCFPSEGSKGFRDLHKRLHLTREDALCFSRIEYLHAVRVQESHELVQVRPLLREFVRGLSQRLGINDPDCRIVGIGKERAQSQACVTARECHRPNEGETAYQGKGWGDIDG